MLTVCGFIVVPLFSFVTKLRYVQRYTRIHLFSTSQIFFFIFNLFKWNKTVYKAVLCPTSISSSWKSYVDKRWLRGRFLGLTLRVHVKSSLGDVHAKVSLLHLSATFCFPPSIKSSFDLLPPFGCCLISVWSHSKPWPCSECLLTASCLRTTAGDETEGWACGVRGNTGPLSGQCGLCLPLLRY